MHQIKLILTGTVPSKKNGKQMICRPFPRMISKPAYYKWHEEWMWKIKKFRPKKPIEMCSIHIDYYGENFRHADLDNKNTTIYDLLKDCEFIIDDNWFVIKEQSSRLVSIDKDNPRAEIMITPIDTHQVVHRLSAVKTKVKSQ